MILNHVKKIRKEMKLTQRDLAKRCELARSTISEIERGLTIPSQLSMMLLSYALNKEVSEVFMLDKNSLFAYFGRNTDQE